MSEPERIRQTGLWDKARGSILCIFTLLSALLGCMYILTPIMPLLFIDHRLWRKVVDRLIGYWLMLPSGLIELVYGTKIRVTGTKIDHSEPALIIMNHRTCLDWLFFWNLLIRMDPWLLTSEKISLKGILKYLPGAGWAMGCNAYMFLDRSFDNDSSRIMRMIDYYANSGLNYQLLLFPEGTDKCERATERSRIYAEKKGLVHYAHVLHPKTTGFTFIIEKMREVGYIKHIYDVTVAYADSIVQSEMDLFLLGACPRSVHYDVRQFEAASLPESDEELAKWLLELWRKKEERLEKFYARECIAERQLDMETNAKLFDMNTRLRTIQCTVATFWMCLTFAWMYIFVSYSSQLSLAALTFSVFIGAQVAYGGIEWIAVKVAARSRLTTALVTNHTD
uniref:Phospholipid/glycerol acyltransferase domain-containing protein n=1 Tax=Parascaris univalens TaxID=6257 RepID=A0A915C8H0_PARUN